MNTQRECALWLITCQGVYCSKNSQLARCGLWEPAETCNQTCLELLGILRCAECPLLLSRDEALCVPGRQTQATALDGSVPRFQRPSPQARDTSRSVLEPRWDLRHDCRLWHARGSLSAFRWQLSDRCFEGHRATQISMREILDGTTALCSSSRASLNKKSTFASAANAANAGMLVKSTSRASLIANTAWRNRDRPHALRAY